jgi:Rieske Fe-S protein
MCALAGAGLTGLFEISPAEAASAVKVRKDGKVDVKVSALHKNGAVVKLPSLNAALVRVSPTKYVAYSLVCTHQGGEVIPNGSIWTCSVHGAQFEAKTGNVVRPPAVRPLTKLKVSVSKGVATVG